LLSTTALATASTRRDAALVVEVAGIDEARAGDLGLGVDGDEVTAVHAEPSRSPRVKHSSSRRSSTVVPATGRLSISRL
jgi:hypothetical protein